LALSRRFFHQTDAVPGLLVSNFASNGDFSVIDHARVLSLLEVLVLFNPQFVFDSLILKEVLNVDVPALMVVGLIRGVIAGEERLDLGISFSLRQSISRGLCAVIAESGGGCCTEAASRSVFG